MSPPSRRNGNRSPDDQGLSEVDQTLSDADQTSSDTDQSLSDRDSVAADGDQGASDREQAVADRFIETARLTGDTGRLAEYERAHAERDEGTVSRAATAVVRALISGERDEQAERRDERARYRDETAASRDQLVDVADRAAETEARAVGEVDARATQAFESAASARRLAGAARARAATDRENAARDREAAAKDRSFLRAEMERAHLDDLTGAYRRGLGEILLRHEMRRADRQGAALTLVFIDADDLKQTNAQLGHAAGDALLRQILDGVQAKLRPYDPIVRWGGDEFVCTISGISTAEARARIASAEASLNGCEPRVSITFGLSTMEPEDTLATLLDRADLAQRRAKQEKRRDQLPPGLKGRSEGFARARGTNG
jgi:diguanylate cyclase (GGDEF)-like protein